MENAVPVATSSLQEIVCCMGQPIAGNPMQYMMEKAITAAGLDLRFLTLEVTPDHLADAVRGIRAMGFRGAILFKPHQTAVTQHVDELTPSARLIGEVNFVDRDGERLIGDNTVGASVLQVARQVVDPAGKRAVILGAGSAAKAIAVQLGLAGVGEIIIVSRTAESGKRLVRLLNEDVEVSARFVHWTGPLTAPDGTALVVQATSISSRRASAQVPIRFDHLAATTVVADLRINPPSDEFLRAATAAGLTPVSGADIRVRQAAIAFHRWTGIEPDRSIMRDALEEFLML